MEAPESPISPAAAAARVSPVKGAWSQVVRGKNCQSGEKMIVDSKGTEAADAKKSVEAAGCKKPVEAAADSRKTGEVADSKRPVTPASPASPLSPKATDPQVMPGSPVDSSILQASAPEDMKPAKQAWKRPVAKNSPVGPLMGACWPALGDTTEHREEVNNMKRTDTKITDVDSERLNSDSAKFSNAGVGDRRSYQGGGNNRRTERRTPRYNNNHTNYQANNYQPNRYFKPYVPPAPSYSVPGYVFYYPSPMAAPLVSASPSVITDSKQAILSQVEFYFSLENLTGDFYLRRLMDHEGFIPVATIAKFPLIQKWTTDVNVVLEALRQSTVVELQGDKIRKHGDWQCWLLPPTKAKSQAVSPSSTLQVLDDSNNEGLKHGEN